VLQVDFAHPVATESQELRSEEAHWSQQKHISDHNTEKTSILWPHLPDEGRTNVESHSVWCDGGQSTERETMSRMDG